MVSNPRTALVTGAASGLGLGVVERLVQNGWRVLVHARTERRASDAVHRVSDAGSGTAEPIVADFDDLESVPELANEVVGRTDRLDALVNNAGVATPNARMLRRMTSANGFLLEWQVNFLVPFALTLLLSDHLLRSAPARVVNVSSVAQGWGRINWTDRNLEHDWDRMAAYAQSKIALTMFTNEFAQRTRHTGLTANSLHPGMCNTKMVRNTFLFAPHTARYGSRNITRLVVDPALDGVTGQYFDETTRTTPNELAADPEARRRLWCLAAADAGIEARLPCVADIVREPTESRG